MTLILKAFVIVLIVACINAQQETVNSAAEVIDDVEIAPSAGDLSRDKRQLGGTFQTKKLYFSWIYCYLYEMNE